MPGVKLGAGIPHATLDRIYDAAFDRSAFGNLSAVLAAAMQASNGVVVIAQNGVPVEVSATTSIESQKSYLNYYGQKDVWTPTMVGTAPFSVTRSHERVADQEVLRSEFYNDYARHLDMWHPIGSICLLAPDQSLNIGINRNRRGQRFSREEEAHFIELMRHVQRALMMRRRFEGSETRVQVGFAALDKLAFAAIVADEAGRVFFANAKAEELARSAAGVTLAGGRIGCAVANQAREFGGLIRNAAKGGAGGAMRLTDASGETTLLTLISPMPSQLSETRDGAGLAFIAVRRDTDDPALAEATVSRLFGLTRSEAQVVCAVSAGATLDEIAAQRGVKITTIKTQIESAFRKTETENQRDLVRLMGKLPQLR